MKYWSIVRRAGGLILLGWAFAGVAQAAATKPIRLHNETITPDQPAGQADAAASQKPADGLFLIQFSGVIPPAARSQLQSLGVELLQYVPEDAFVARFENVRPGQVRQLGFVRWVGPYHPEHKIHRALTHSTTGATNAPRSAPTSSLSMPDTFDVAVLVSPRATPAERAQTRLFFSQLRQESTNRFGGVLRGRISREQLTPLARSGAVLWIEPAPAMRLFDEVSSRIVGGDGPPGQTLVQSLGYTGAGVTVAVADSGLDSGDTNSMHPDIQGRVKALFHYGAPGQLDDAADEHSHGTHCAGIIAGNGATGEFDESGYLYGLGVAPGAGLIGQRIFDAAGGYAPPPSFETLTRDAKRAGADIGSNSWGDDTQGEYDLSAMEFDALVRDADLLALGDQPYILEFSAGNAGPGTQTIGSPAVAKNVIATGASQNDRFNLPIEEFSIYADGRDAMADFSSRGPCADGRIKPDLVAPGSWIASLRSIYANDDYAWWPISENYLYQGGTSQAGPQISGAAAVFVQYWRTTHGGGTPSPALVKAALINSATDLDDGLTTFDAVPNNDEGWGRVNLPALIGAARNYDFTDQSILLTNGAVFEKTILIGSSAEPLKITLAYTDVPGLPAAAAALVNDLDLEVISPTDEIFRGNRFEAGESTPDVPLPDTINNVEAVHIAAPVPGEYLVRVRASRVVEDARIDSPTVDQDFALVLSGKFAPAGVGIITFNRPAYRAPDQIKLTLADYNLAGQPSATIQLRSGAEPLGETITLFPKLNTGVFTNTVPLTATAPSADGKLQVAHGNLIEASYADAAPAANRIATARADLLPPAISNLTATNEFGQLLLVWNTDEPTVGEIYYGTNILNLALTNRVLDVSQEFPLAGIPVNAVARYFVVAQDEAGNRTTNDNSGSWFTVTNTQPPTVLLVDSYTDNGGFIAAPPLAGYTDALDAINVSYEVFETSASLPTLAQLRAYRCVIWRLDEISAPDPTLAQRVASYVTGGGSLFISGMDTITRLGEAGAMSFATNILQVQSHTEDVTVDEVAGFPGDPIGAGLDVTLDFSPYADLMAFLQLIGVSDPCDWIVPTSKAAPVLMSNGQTVGLRAPKTGADLPGRVVFLSFPLDTVPLGSGSGNNRSGLLQNALNFLAPATNTSNVTLDRDVYSLPGRAIVEVDDVDRRGQRTATVVVRSPQRTNQLSLTLLETARGGLFRGSVLFAPTNSGTPGVYVVQASDAVRVDYFDESANRTNSATATIDTNAPTITGVIVEPGYLEAIVSWDTSKDADSLVQYGEAPNNLPNNFVAYDPLLTTAHELFLSNLKPGTTYYFRVTSRDRAGNTTIDDNHGNLYTFTTLIPLAPPWFDNLETNNANWSVITADESEAGWTRGPPGGGETAHSGTNCWSSNLSGAGISQMESYLISPGILLTGGNKATLRFWHNYDFLAQSEFEFQLAAIEIITNVTTAPQLLYQMPEDYSLGWEEMEINLTPYLGNVVYLVWYHFLFSFDAPPRPGWLVDDVSINVSTIVPGTVQITNNVWQAVFALSGPSGRTAKGRWLTITNATAGQYVIQYGDVLYHNTPANQTNLLTPGGTITFSGNYTFTDANSNSIPDPYELEKFSQLDPLRTQLTDTDHDGLSDWEEYIAGSDPVSPDATFQASATVLTNQQIRLDWPTAPGHGYRVQGSSNTINWLPITEWRRVAGYTANQTLPLSTNGPASYFRVEAQP